MPIVLSTRRRETTGEFPAGAFLRCTRRARYPRRRSQSVPRGYPIGYQRLQVPKYLVEIRGAVSLVSHCKQRTSTASWNRRSWSAVFGMAIAILRRVTGKHSIRASPVPSLAVTFIPTGRANMNAQSERISSHQPLSRERRRAHTSRPHSPTPVPASTPERIQMVFPQGLVRAFGKAISACGSAGSYPWPGYLVSLRILSREGFSGIHGYRSAV